MGPAESVFARFGAGVDRFFDGMTKAFTDMEKTLISENPALGPNPEHRRAVATVRAALPDTRKALRKSVASGATLASAEYTQAFERLYNDLGLPVPPNLGGRAFARRGPFEPFTRPTA